MIRSVNWVLFAMASMAWLAAAEADEMGGGMSGTVSTHFLMEMGLHYGGDEMVEVVYTNGDSSDTDGGEGVALSLGVSIDAPAVETRLKAGWKYKGISASNGDIDWQRFPIDALVLYKVDQWRFGGGLTYHLNPTFRGSGVASVLDVDFDNALGALAEIDFYVSPQLYLGAVYTMIEYEPKGLDATVNADSIGVQAAFVF